LGAPDGFSIIGVLPVYRLHPSRLDFPPPEEAEPDGLLAVGGDLRPERLLAAYAQGIFPWYSEGLPILWHSPDPRFVLLPGELHVGRSLRKVIKRGEYTFRLDTAFEKVMAACGKVKRPGQRGTWITQDMKRAYSELHRLGFAHSAEAWRGEELVGGLYGVSLGSAFFGESMFALAPDASKVAFVLLSEQLVSWGFTLIDCQVETEHLARFGAVPWPREQFLLALADGLKAPTRRGKWEAEVGDEG
jgi:leucyl/phenylalanyl-tRNA--protein transferase